jgi:hypothetical protein
MFGKIIDACGPDDTGGFLDVHQAVIEGARRGIHSRTSGSPLAIRKQKAPGLETRGLPHALSPRTRATYQPNL